AAIDLRLRLLSRRRRSRLLRACHAHHLLCDLCQQSSLIKIPVIPALDVRELGANSCVAQRLLQQARGLVEMISVNRADSQMNLVLQQRAQPISIVADNRRDVIPLPRTRDSGIDFSGCAIKQTLRSAIVCTWTEDPLERSHLSAVLAEDSFLAGKIFKRNLVFAFNAHQHPRRARRVSIKVLRWISEKVRSGEAVKIGGIRRGWPGSSEKFWIGDLQPQHCPAAGGMAVQQTAARLRVHAIFLFQ